MKRCKRLFAAMLAVMMVITLLPESFVAAELQETPVEIVDESTDTGNADVEISTEEVSEVSTEEAEVSAEVETEVTEISADAEVSGDLAETEELSTEVEMEVETPSTDAEVSEITETDVDATGTVVDDYTLLEAGEGNEQVRTEQSVTERFSFQPEEDGFYHLNYQGSADAQFALNIYNENGLINRLIPELRDKNLDMMFYLTADRSYVFEVMLSGTSTYQLGIYQAEVTDIRVKTAPEKAVYNSIDYTGMEVEITYTEGPAAVSKVSGSNNYGWIMNFNYINYLGSSSISGTNGNFSAQTLDGESVSLYNYDWSNATDGEHTVGATILINNQTYTLSIPITVERNSVASIEVLGNTKTAFEEGLGQNLLSDVVTIQVNYLEELGREPIAIKTSNSTSANWEAGTVVSNEIVRYLEYTDEGGNIKKTYLIDDYLANGGSLGKATVYVEYHNAKTSYEITISEYPYESMSVELNCYHYFANCDYIDKYSDIKSLTLKCKNGISKYYSSIYSLENGGSLLKAGLYLEETDTFYSSPESYVEAGGAYGEATYRVSYGSVSCDLPVTIAENPYDHIEIQTLPNKIVYPADISQSLDYRGLVIRGYKNAEGTEYEDLSYDEYVTNASSPKTEEQYLFSKHFYSYLEGHNSINYLEEGEHLVYVKFYGKETTFTIKVTKEFLSDFTISVPPTKTDYLVSEDEQSITSSGMKFSFTYQGTKYEDMLVNSVEYITFLTSVMGVNFGNALQFDTSEVDWSTPNTYTVPVSFLGAESSIQIHVIAKLIDGLELISPPTKPEYYIGSNTGYSVTDFSGLKVEVTQLDGTKKQYTYNNNWYELSSSGYYKMDTSAVDWNTVGTYPVKLSYGGYDVSFDIQIVDSPVEKIQIDQMPKMQTLARPSMYNMNLIDLSGLQFTIQYKDSTEEPYTINWDENSSSSGYILYQNRNYYWDLSWKLKDTQNSSYPALGENAIVIRYLGVTEEIPVTLVENPVVTLQYVKRPEITSYPVYNYGAADLYGAQFQIIYADSTVQTVDVTEHGNSVKVYNEEQHISGRLSSYWSSNGYGEYYLQTSFYEKYCSIPMDPFDYEAAQSGELTEDETYALAIPEGKTYQIYKFVPKESKQYYIQSGYINTGNYSVQMNICRENGNSIATFSGNGMVSLTAGETYYLVCGAFVNGAINGLIRIGSSYTDALKLNTDDIVDFKIVKVPRTRFFDYEQYIYLHTANLSASEYELTLKSGDVLTGTIYNSYNGYYDYEGGKYHGNIMGIPLTAKFKAYKRYEYEEDEDEYSEYADTTVENSIIFTLGNDGEFTSEIPITFNNPSPVKSMVVNANPWKDGVYQFEAESVLEDDYYGLSITVTYEKEDGTEATEEMVWEENQGTPSLEGNYVSLRWKNYSYDENDDEYLTIGENALIATLMGKSVEIPVTVKANPVASIEVKKAPEKTAYLEFEDSVDLYGLELSIQYTDGTQKLVQITEHVSSFYVNDSYGLYLRGRLRTSYDEQDREQRYIQLSYMGVNTKISCESNSIKSLFAQAVEIGPGVFTEVSLDDATRYVLFKYTAEKSAKYEFYSTGDYDTYAYLYAENGSRITSDDDGSDEGCNFLIDEVLEEGRTYYYLVRMLSTGEEGTFQVILSDGSERTPIEAVELTLEAPVAGEDLSYALRDVSGTMTGYRTSMRWLQGDDEVADYGVAYRAQVTLTPLRSYRFTKDTAITLNGKKVTGKSLSTNGTVTFAYTFPHTDCRVRVPEVEGYTLEESVNEYPGRTAYGGAYRFQYVSNTALEELPIVKSNNELLYPKEDGYYHLDNIKTNITITAKPKQAGTETGKTRLDFYNKGALEDYIFAYSDRAVEENDTEDALPMLPSYINGSDEFFFGWYQDETEDKNGCGVRFKSSTLVPKQSNLELFAKWGVGLFSRMYNNKQVNYKILSIDENNRMKVQIGDVANASARAVDATGADETGMLEIPATLEDIDVLEELGIEGASCEVTSIAANAFTNLTGVTNIKLPDTIEQIASGAFSGCTDLVSVNIPKSVSTIEENLFSGCTNLEEVEIPEGVTNIATGAFEGCTSLTKVTIPDTMEEINADAFKDVDMSKMTVVCSSENVESVQNAIGTEAKISTEDLFLSYEYSDLELTYGDRIAITASVFVDGKEDAALSEKITASVSSDNYQIEKLNNVFTITPQNAADTTEAITFSYGVKSKAIAVNTARKSLSGAVISEIPTMTYTGSPICPEFVVTLNGQTLQKNVDYMVDYYNNVNPGTDARFEVYGIGNYTGYIETCFTIASAANPSNPGGGSTPGNGSTSGDTSNPPSDQGTGQTTETTYTITYQLNGGNNHPDNLASYKASTGVGSLKNPTRKGYTFVGWYSGSTKVTMIPAGSTGNYTLSAKWKKVTKPGKPTLKSLTAGKKAFTVKLKKKVSGASGYEIVYATNSKFTKGKKTVRVTAASKKISKLKSKKTYYVKVRAYKLDSAGNRVYGSYCKAKKVKVK